MKRLATLAFTLCLSLGMTWGLAASAKAIEVKPSGVMDFVFTYGNTGIGKFQETETDHFGARTRSRIQIDFIANENLKGVLMLQMGAYEWGSTTGYYGGGAALDTTAASPLVRRLYIDFNFPDSPVNMKMGLLELTLPYAAFGQPVIGNHVAAVTATANLTDNASLTAFWARPYRETDAAKAPGLKNNDMDIFGLWANLDFESLTVAPWAAYASIGSNSYWWTRELGSSGANGPHAAGKKWESDDSDWWGAGLALKLMPSDSLTFKFDAMYASLDNGSRDTDLNNAPEGEGYYFALDVTYAMDWGTPGVFAIYSSGDDADDEGKFGRLPGLAYGTNIWPTLFSTAGSMTCGRDSMVNVSGLGVWLVGLKVSDISFIENVTHVAKLSYWRGTNHIDSELIRDKGKGRVPGLGNNIPLAYEDQMVEASLATKWQMYENLTVQLELGYLYLDATDKGSRDDYYDQENGFVGNLIFRFGF